MKKEHLHLLIDEEIYLIRRSFDPSKNHEKEAPSEPKKAQVGEAKKPQNFDKKETSEVLNNPVVPVAIFHEATENEELELLQKIIGACKLEDGQYQIFDNGFDKKIGFEKGIVFSEKATSYYQTTTYKKSKILCSKPLDKILKMQNEKVKLWNALKVFF